MLLESVRKESTCLFHVFRTIVCAVKLVNTIFITLFSLIFVLIFQCVTNNVISSKLYFIICIFVGLVMYFIYFPM